MLVERSEDEKQQVGVKYYPVAELIQCNHALSLMLYSWETVVLWE